MDMSTDVPEGLPTDSRQGDGDDQPVTSAPGPAPDSAAGLRALDRLVGQWRIDGDAVGHSSYRWLPGGRFLVQEGSLRLLEHENTFTEVIGRLKPFGEEAGVDIVSRVYTAEGDTLDYVYDLNGDTLIIWGGERGSSSKYVGTFSDDGDTLTGSWSWPGGGYATVTTRMVDTDEGSEVTP